MNAGERRAARHYRLRGWRVIGANVRVGRDELDLIVRRGNALRIVEVKEKTGDAYGTPLDMIDARKLAHVRRATLRWLAANPEFARLDVRLEAVGIHRGRLTRVHLYEAAERW